MFDWKKPLWTQVLKLGFLLAILIIGPIIGIVIDLYRLDIIK